MNIMQPIPSTESVKNQSLAGKVVLVTGGASGLGAALCRVLADAGADVAICDLHPQFKRAAGPEREEETGEHERGRRGGDEREDEQLLEVPDDAVTDLGVFPTAAERCEHGGLLVRAACEENYAAIIVEGVCE